MELNNIFKIFPERYLGRVRPKEYLKRINELIKISYKRFRDVHISPKAFEFAVKWSELPVNYKIKPEGVLKETLITSLKEKMKVIKVKKLVNEVGIPRASFYRFLDGKHISIKNFIKLLEYLNLNLELDEEQLSIVAGNGVIKRNRKRLEELVNSIIREKVEEKLHWFHAYDLLLKIPNGLWEKIAEIIKLKYLNFAFFAMLQKFHLLCLEKGIEANCRQ